MLGGGLPRRRKMMEEQMIMIPFNNIEVNLASPLLMRRRGTTVIAMIVRENLHRAAEEMKIDIPWVI
jgi:hypothetical protein